MTRAFIAVVPPAGVLDAVAERVASLRIPPGARVPTRERWHITVQFLGDEADVDAVAAAFANEPLDLAPGTAQLGGALVFGRARQARILAVGLCAGEAWIRELADRVGTRLEPLGYERAAAPDFRPHLTIARFREPTDLRSLRAQLGSDPVGASWTVAEAVLFESILRPEGARHVAREHLPVRATAR